jgi:hypothetical protein
MRTESFISMFDQDEIRRIEIPKIQRDYAQGRPDEIATRIRKDFLGVLYRALTDGDRVSLDFVYGEITADGVMIPLDGQQRLTTLFLLHWYIAARAGVQGGDSQVLLRFTYETRYSARDFCEKLVAYRPTFPIERLSEWIRDQSWYFGAWRYDPTIQSMLVVLDELHNLFRSSDCVAVWERLVDRDRAAVVFQVLSIKNMGLTDDLYIKMNSRGQPLTKFEHFKANFEKTLREASPQQYTEFSQKIDNAWADLLWPLRGGNDVIDDEFMRYFRFVTDVLVYRRAMNVSSEVLDQDISDGAALVYGAHNPKWEANQRFLFDAFDHGISDDIAQFLSGLFTDQGWKPGAVAIYDSVNLFEACCKDYGKMEWRNRKFSLPRTLLLFAVLVHRISGTPDFPRRIRTIRNLVFGSENETRLENFPTLLADTSHIVEKGGLDSVTGYNAKQVEEERNKTAFLKEHPELEEALFRLEDHSFNRGCVAAFELDAATFARRAAAFFEVFSDDGSVPLLEVSGALLACGDYSQRKRTNRYQFGSATQKDVWRQLLTGAPGSDFSNMSGALMRMLDAIGGTADGPVRTRLRRVVHAYLAEQEKAGLFDWRYYLVKYDEMRAGASGLYVGPENEGKGFDLCMMVKQQMNSNYRDPYLFAVYEHIGAVANVDLDDPWHTGYQTEERWLTLSKSGARLRCRPEGFVLSPPQDGTYADAFAEVMKKQNIDATLTLRIQQVSKDGALYDTQNRVQVGAALVRDLLAMKAV